MPTVFIPTQFRDLTSGTMEVEVPASNMRQVVAGLDAQFPGLRDRICVGDAIAPGLAIWIDGSISSRGLLATVRDDSQIHLLPAFGGG